MRKHHCSDGARGLLSCKRATLAEPRAQSAVLSWLLDWRLPHERGCEVARDLARWPRSCQPTAHGEPQAASRSALALTAAVVVLTALVSWWLLRRWKAHKALHRELMQREETRMRAARELPRRAYTLEDLQRFDGSDDDRPIALVCNGDVFNVSDARDLYGGEGCYAALSGKDASRLLAKGERLVAHVCPSLAAREMTSTASPPPQASCGMNRQRRLQIPWPSTRRQRCVIGTSTFHSSTRSWVH
jgi:predicted heme/steroid binding protein